MASRLVPESTQAETIQANSHLSYLDCRGRLECVLLLLADADHPYSLETIPLSRWRETEADPARFPFNVLPTLREGYAHDGRTLLFSETSAILRYFAASLRSPETAPVPSAIALARHDQILEASLFFTGNFLNAGTEADWLEQVKLQKLWRDTVKPFMQALEYILQENIMPPLAPQPLQDGRPGTLLSAASVAAAYAIELVASLFGAEQIKKDHGECMRLRDSIYTRRRVAAWLTKSGQLQRDRIAIAPYATYQLVSAAAEKIRDGQLRIA